MTARKASVSKTADLPGSNSYWTLPSSKLVKQRKNTPPLPLVEGSPSIWAQVNAYKNTVMIYSAEGQIVLYLDWQEALRVSEELSQAARAVLKEVMDVAESA